LRGQRWFSMLRICPKSGRKGLGEKFRMIAPALRMPYACIALE